MDNYNQLFHSIFKREMGAPDTVNMLEETTASYPYFTPAQFFLLYLTNKDSPAYAAQAKKTGVLFNNNYWLNYLLLSEAGNTEVPASHDFSDSLETIAGVQYHTDESGENIEHVATEIIPEAAAVLPEWPVIDEEIIIVSEPAVEQLFEADEIPAAIKSVDDTEQIEALLPVETLPNADIIPVEESTLSEVVAPEVQPADELVENFDASVNETDAATSKASPQEEVSMAEEQQLPEENIILSNEPTAINSIENEAPLQPIPFNLSKEQVTEDTITFEPLHTSDYFASVGIKLSEEAKPVDRLGQQMKSFTEWLKTMKKIHAEQFAETGTAPQSAAQKNEQHIQQLAEASNKEGEIVTEAMADVLVQQGRVGKAVAILEKLRLLNTGKITYFAAKINQLKEQ